MSLNEAEAAAVVAADATDDDRDVVEEVEVDGDRGLDE